MLPGASKGAPPVAKKPPAQPTSAARSKRLTIDVSPDLHQRIKLASVMKGENMADTLRAVLAREFPPRKSGSAAA
jgi:hypothetical protein